MKYNILGVKVDDVSLDQAVDQVKNWIKNGGKHYIVTPNPEIIMAAQNDDSFKRLLNKADLSLPDSSRLNWALWVTSQKNPLLKLCYFLLYPIPYTLYPKYLPVTTGTDLTDSLIKLANEKGFTIGFLGGRKNVALKLVDCLIAKQRNFKIGLATGNITVDTKGGSQFKLISNEMIQSKDIKPYIGVNSAQDLDKALSQKLDILFVGFGQQKQEHWIAQNLPKLNIKVMIGVGGALDYLSGEVPRAPTVIRALSLEWLFRLVIEPWRIKRFGNLVKFIFRILAAT